MNDRIELWNTFIKSIFYIGKGKLRTTIVDDDYCHHLQHLNSAFSEYHAVPRPKVDEKASCPIHFFSKNFKHFSNLIEVLLFFFLDAKNLGNMGRKKWRGMCASIS